MSNLGSAMPVRGAAEMLKNLGTVQAGAVAGARKGLGIALHLILQVSSRKVPHEEGDLQRDGAVVVDDTELIGAVTYGNTPDTAAYAVRQHEELDWQHDDGREAKYLENARNETRDKVRAIIGENIAEGLRGRLAGGDTVDLG